MSLDGKYLNREQAAAYIAQRLGIAFSPMALAKRASLNTGPIYRLWGGRGPGKGGRGRFAVYLATDLDLWIEQQFHEPTREKADGTGDSDRKASTTDQGNRPYTLRAATS